MTTTSLARPAAVAIPRGALLTGWLFDLGAALLQRVRAAQATDLVALRAAREAAALRRLALRVQDSDPRQAADLRAAADRHLGDR